MKLNRDLTQKLVMATLVIVPLIFIPIGQGDYFYMPKVFALRLIVIAYLFVIYKYRNKLSDIISSDWINRILLIYFLWLVFSTVFSIGLEYSIYGNPVRYEGLTTIMLYFIVYLIARQQGTISKKNIVYMLLAGSVIVIYGILQSYGYEIFPRDFIREKWIRAFSTMGNPNFLGSYIVLLLPFSAHLYLVHKRLFGLFSYAILFIGLLATFTRGAWIGALVAIGIYGLIILYNRKKLYVLSKDILIIIAVTIICFIGFDISKSGNLILRLLSISNDFNDVLSGGANLESAGANRMFIWLKTIELIKLRPIVGFGIENLQFAFNQYFSADILKTFGYAAQIDKAHNEYLNIAVTTGIPALVLYLTFITLIVRKGVARLLDLPYAIPLLVAVLGYLVQAFFNISVVSVAYIFWAFLGFMASSKPLEN